MKIIKEFPPTEPIVSMIQFKDQILVATSWRVYRLRSDDTFEPLSFLAPTDEDVPGREKA